MDTMIVIGGQSIESLLHHVIALLAVRLLALLRKVLVRVDEEDVRIVLHRHQILF